MLFACAGEPEPATLRIPDECAGLADQLLCSANVALECVAGAARTRDDCSKRGLVCANGLGCRACVPHSIACEGQTRLRCDAQGGALQQVEECAAGLSCGPAECVDLCAQAAANKSYLGCDYWPVFTVNSQLPNRFRPAVSIGNGNLVPANITITKGDFRVELEVPPRSARTLELEFDARLRSAAESLLVRQGAYHLRSSVPVTVHQFNPLYFELSGDCTDHDPQPGDRLCNSYTNDASLLFPTSASTPDPERDEGFVSFMVAARASFMFDEQAPGARPGFAAIVALGERPVQVSIVSRAYTLATLDPLAADAIEALAPGQTLSRTLQPGDVLQLMSAAPASCPVEWRSVDGRSYCDPGADYDLTGTLVRADGPLQVIGGHDCTNVPFDRPFCDHLEEALPPLHTWGNAAIVTAPRTPDGSGTRVRVISAVDDNAIQFEPPLQAPIVLQRGQQFEFETSEPLFVRGAKPLLVAQYLLGQGLIQNVGGDPSLSFAVPVDQYRNAYNFTSPSTYTSNYVDIVAAVDDLVRLDGVIVKGFAPLGQSGYATATVQLMNAGAHELIARRGLGLQLYGSASFTSYMLPGGLDLQPIAGTFY